MGAGPPGPGPEAGRLDTPPIPHRALGFFGTDAIEIRFVSGSFNEPGPAMAWFRLRVAVVNGEAPSPLQRLAAARDQCHIQPDLRQGDCRRLTNPRACSRHNGGSRLMHRRSSVE